MIKAYFRVSTSSKKGRQKLSRSFVKAFIDLMYSNLSEVVYALTDTSGNTVTPYAVSVPEVYSCSSGYGNNLVKSGIFASSPGGITCAQAGAVGEGDLFGIIVGSGSMAVTTIDDNIQTKIEHGTSAGQLEYLGEFMPADVTVSGSNASFNIERLFYNGSGGDVTVNEVGLYAGIFVRTAQYTYTTKYYCLIRDLVSPAVTVANGEYLKVAYTIQISV